MKIYNNNNNNKTIINILNFNIVSLKRILNASPLSNRLEVVYFFCFIQFKFK